MRGDKYILIDAYYLRKERVIEFVKKAKKNNLKICVVNTNAIASENWEKKVYAETRAYCINPVEKKLNTKVVDCVILDRTMILSFQKAAMVKNCVLILSNSSYFNRKIMKNKILKSIKVLNYNKNNWEKRSDLFLKSIKDENL